MLASAATAKDANSPCALKGARSLFFPGAQVCALGIAFHIEANG